MEAVINSRSMELMAWGRKYLTVASVSCWVLDSDIRGIRESMFSSNPIQKVSQLWAERDNSVPDIMDERNKGVEGEEVNIKLRWNLSPPKFG